MEGPGEPFTGPHGKRPEETLGLHQPSEGSQRLSEDDALAYIKEVRDTFKDNTEKYQDFLDIMKALKDERIGEADVIARVRDLLTGHRSLILGFNIFLPEGYKLTVPPEESPTKKQRDEFN